MSEQKKDGMFVVGTLNAKDEYEGKNGISYTFQIAIQGFKSMLPVRVSAEIFHKTEVGVKILKQITYQETKWGSTFSLVPA